MFVAPVHAGAQRLASAAPQALGPGVRRGDGMGRSFRGKPLASIYQLKPAFQGVLRPLVRALARAGVTANQVTLAAVALAFAVGAALLACDGRAVLLLLPIALFLRMALNAI